MKNASNWLSGLLVCIQKEQKCIPLELTFTFYRDRFYSDLYLGQKVGKLGQGISVFGSGCKRTHHRLSSTLSIKIPRCHGTLLFDGTRCLGVGEEEPVTSSKSITPSLDVLINCFSIECMDLLFASSYLLYSVYLFSFTVLNKK